MASKDGVGDDEVDPLANPGQNVKDSTSKAASKRPLLQPSSDKDENPSAGNFSPDELSKAGKFGWCQVAGVSLPVIFRSEGESFLSVRMTERALLSRFLQVLPNEVVTCPFVHSFRMTEVEARLMNEINTKHADNQYGKESFTIKDLVVKKEDVDKFYQFLDLCYKKMIIKKSTDKDLCGFLRIGGTSDVPYADVGGVKHLPLFYFEGEGSIDPDKCLTLTDWDWAYLRFCCKVQGVKDELIADDKCEAVALQELRQYFAPGTSFVEYWPNKDFISRVVSKKVSRQGSWTRVITNYKGRKFQGKLTLIMEYPLQQTSQATYKAARCSIEGNTIQCINIKPYQYKEVMITLPHMVEQLFPGFTEEQVGNMLVSQDVMLYKGNSGHVEVIKQEGWEDKYSAVPLVTVKDIFHHIKNWRNALKAADLGGKRFKGI